MRIDDWVRGHKKGFAWLVVLTIVILFFWYLFLPYPTPSVVEFVYIEVDIELNETYPDVRVSANLGPHCPLVHRFGGQVAVDSDVLTLGTEVVVMIQYRLEDQVWRTFISAGGGVDHYLSEEKKTEYGLVGVADQDCVLSTISIDGNDLSIDGRTYGPGDTWRETFEYPAKDGNLNITERVVLENMGYSVAWAKTSYGCD
jgi:hypothetical protein